MKNAKIKVVRFVRGKRHISVNWLCAGEVHETLIYRHTDGSWHMDPDSAALGEEFVSELRRACDSYRRRKNSPYNNIKVWFAD